MCKKCGHHYDEEHVDIKLIQIAGDVGRNDARIQAFFGKTHDYTVASTYRELMNLALDLAVSAGKAWDYLLERDGVIFSDKVSAGDKTPNTP